jgi:FemAB-related protein (PEP-CTERM system-associated)
MKHGWTEVAPPGAPVADLRVRAAGDSDMASWDNFVQGCPEATFFHRAGWRTIMEEVFGHRTFFLLAERGGSMVGVLPLAQVRSWMFGNVLVSLPFCVYGGVAASEPLAASELTGHAEELARSLGVRHLELRHIRPRNPGWPAQDLYVTFRRPILPEVEDNMLAIPRKQRAMVRKGAKNGLRSELDAGTDRFFGLYSDNVHRHGTPALPRRYFQTLQRVFGRDCEVLTVVDQGGTPVSSVLSFYFRDEVLPYYAGDHVSARDAAANDFKYWELMRRACERGYRVFDYGRSKQGTGSFDFKKNWGFEPAPLHYEYRLFRGQEIPQNNPANPKYKAFIAMWQRLPLPLANALGPYIVRNLG